MPIRLGRAELCRLRDGKAARKRELLDRARHRTHAAPGRAVGLGDDQRNFVASFEQALERLRGESWRPGED
jgi:hypothetical protein